MGENILKKIIKTCLLSSALCFQSAEFGCRGNEKGKFLYKI